METVHQTTITSGTRYECDFCKKQKKEFMKNLIFKNDER